MITLLDNLYLVGKANGNGREWSGSLPGMLKVPHWKPTTTAKQVRDAFGGLPGEILIHNEEGVDYPLNPTKAQMKAVVDTNTRIAADAAREFRGVPTWAYGHRHLHDPWWRAWKGDKKAAQQVKECESHNEDMIRLGYPGEGVTGIMVDLYDFEHMAECWKDRAAYECEWWTNRGFRVLTIVSLKYKEGRYLTDTEARSVIEHAARYGDGRVCVFEAPEPGEVCKSVSQYPHAALLESIARGN